MKHTAYIDCLRVAFAVQQSQVAGHGYVAQSFTRARGSIGIIGCGKCYNAAGRTMHTVRTRTATLVVGKTMP